jgi:hypothetical protein
MKMTTDSDKKQTKNDYTTSIPLKKLIEGLKACGKAFPAHMDALAFVVFQVNGCAYAYEIDGIIAAKYRDQDVLMIMSGDPYARLNMDIDKAINEDQISWGTIN